MSERELVCMGMDGQFSSLLDTLHFSLILHHTLILVFHFSVILSPLMLNIKHVLPTRRIPQITKLCSFKVTWISPLSDAVLSDDVCMTRFLLVLAEGKKSS